MLQYLQQLQILVRSLAVYFSPHVDAHRATYMSDAHDYDFILYHDFSQLKALIGNCAASHHDMERFREHFGAASIH